MAAAGDEYRASTHLEETSHMPLPTTRYQRFLYRRKKYLKRARRQNHGWWKYEFDGLYYRKVFKKITIPGTSKQLTGLATKNTVVAGIIPPTIFPFPPLATLTFDGVHKTPHVHLHPYWWSETYRPDRAFAHYHRQRVRYRYRYGTRQGLEHRREWGARAFVYANYYWPMWDPLQRRPNELDFAETGEDVTFTHFPYQGQTSPD